jgi:uncharacterized surface protein with fasciclin (FAS1) repeats
MKHPKLTYSLSAVVALALLVPAAAAAAAVPSSPAATAHQTTAAKAGHRSLAAVLLKDKSGFDRKGRDFDIATAAVLAVLKAKPDSPVAVLTDGSVPLTAFVPTDNAFRRLVKSVTGHTYASERKVFNAVAGLGIDTVEQVLEYHVVPGATITARQALKANGAVLDTAQGSTITVAVNPFIHLRDQDPDALNPRVILSLTNINKGNAQIAHGINRVLRPIDLPAAG